MPLSEYYGGKGEQVMKKMKAKHGDKKGKQVFYANAKKKGLEPSKDFMKKHNLKEKD